MAIKLSDIDFSTTTSLAIPQGNVIKITKNGNVVVWEKPATDEYATAGSLSVGNIVYLNVNGTPREFIIVHQGNPNSSIYDSSCDGTWILQKDIYEERIWNTGFDYYNNSEITTYLNGDYLMGFDDDVQESIKQVKIPVNTHAVMSMPVIGNIETKIFLPSSTEIGYADSTYVTEGSVLSYFSSGTNDTRIAYFAGTANKWWTRTRNKTQSYVGCVDATGSLVPGYMTSGGDISGGMYTYNSYGARPAMILDPLLTVLYTGN